MLQGDRTATLAIRRTTGIGWKLTSNSTQLSLSWLAETSQRPQGENPQSLGFAPPLGKVRHRAGGPSLGSIRKFEIESSPLFVTAKWTPSGCILRPDAVFPFPVDASAGSRDDSLARCFRPPSRHCRLETSDDNSLTSTTV